MHDLHHWLQYLETLDPNHVDLGLDRLFALNNIHTLTNFSCPVITVTGTNGKGSCVALLEAILLAAGYRVGCYTSPHIKHFNERIRLNGTAIADQPLLDALAYIEHTRADIPLTYFEFTTLAALHVFQQHPLDVLILEVGLGGRLDAVNVVDADIAVITSIAIDHTAWLGNSRESIATEKAGILRPYKPLVCGDPQPPLNMLSQAETLHAPCYVANRDFFYSTNDQQSWDFHSQQQDWLDLTPPHLGINNAATALQSLALLPKDFHIEQTHIQQGLHNAQLPGRFQCVTGEVLTIFDVAHNPAAAAYLATRLQQHACAGRTLAVIGMLDDKDIAGTCEQLRPVVDAWYASRLNTSRTASAERLSQTLSQLHITQQAQFDTIQQAFEQACDDATSNDRVLIVGSFHTVSELLYL